MSSQQNGPVTAFRQKVLEGTEDVLKRQVPTPAHAGLVTEHEAFGLDWWELFLIVVDVFMNAKVHIETIKKHLIWDSGSFHVDMQLELSSLLL